MVRAPRSSDQSRAQDKHCAVIGPEQRTIYPCSDLFRQQTLASTLRSSSQDKSWEGHQLGLAEPFLRHHPVSFPVPTSAGRLQPQEQPAEPGHHQVLQPVHRDHRVHLAGGDRRLQPGLHRAATLRAREERHRRLREQEADRLTGLGEQVGAEVQAGSTRVCCSVLSCWHPDAGLEKMWTHDQKGMDLGNWQPGVVSDVMP